MTKDRQKNEKDNNFLLKIIIKKMETRCLGPDPVCPERLDPDADQVFPERLVPDPVNIRPDPKPSAHNHTHKPTHVTTGPLLPDCIEVVVSG